MLEKTSDSRYTEVKIMTPAERCEYLEDAYSAIAKISSSALLAGEKCPKGDKQALYKIACTALGLVYCLKDDARISAEQVGITNESADPASWDVAQIICDLPSVDDAIRILIEDNSGDNATGLVRVVLEAAARRPVASVASGGEAAGYPADKPCICPVPQQTFSEQCPRHTALPGKGAATAQPQPRTQAESVNVNADIKASYETAARQWVNGQPSTPAAPSDEEIIAINEGERFFSVSESRFGRDCNPHDQYHSGKPGVLQFARELLRVYVAAAQPQPRTQAEIETLAEELANVGCDPGEDSWSYLQKSEREKWREVARRVFSKGGAA